MDNDENKINTLLSAALDLNKAGDEERAIGLLNDVLEINPNFYLAYLLLGNIYDDLGDLSHTEKSYLKAYSIVPKNTLINKTLSAFLFSQGRYSEAINYLEYLFNEDPTDIDIVNMLYFSFEHIPEREHEAHDVLKLAWEKTKDYTIGIKLGSSYAFREEYKTSIEILSEVLKEKKTSEVLSDLASMYLLSGEIDKALELSDEAIKLNPEDDDAWLQKAMSYLLLPDFDFARDAVEIAYSIDPENFVNAYVKGEILLYQEEFEEYLDFSQDIIDLFKNINDNRTIFEKMITHVLLKRFILYQELDKPDKALEDMIDNDKFISGDSKLLSIAEEHLDSKYQPEELIRIIESISDPYTQHKLLPWHCKILHTLNRAEDAWDLIYPYFQKTPETKGERAWAVYTLFQLSQVSWDLYFNDELPNPAISIMKQILKINPDLDPLVTQLAYFQIGAGEFNEAQEILRRLIDSQLDKSSNQIVTCHLAYLYNITGKYQDSYDLLSALISENLLDEGSPFRVSYWFDKKMLPNHNLQGYIININDAAYACAISAALALGLKNGAENLITKFEINNHKKRLFLEIKGCYELETGNIEGAKEAWSDLLAILYKSESLDEVIPSLSENDAKVAKFIYLGFEKDKERINKWLNRLKRE